MHLLGGDVVVEQRLAVLQGCSVRKTTDEVGVVMRVTRAGSEMAGHVVGCCWQRRKRWSGNDRKVNQGHTNKKALKPSNSRQQRRANYESLYG